VPAPRTEKNQEIRRAILQTYSEHDKRPGPVKVRILLKSDYGINISAGRVYRLMKTMELPSLVSKRPKFKPFVTEETECVNRLEKRFSQVAPDIVWVSDITYIRAGGRFYYLCVIIDLFSRKVIAYKISARPDAQLVKNAFAAAYFKRNPKGLMFHSDRGCQYTAFSFRQLLDNCNVVQSFSKKGHPYDNAVAESFFKYLKQEETNRRNYQTLKELELSVFQYIEGYYNSKRPHGGLNYLTPNQVEINFFSQT
jgi:transposase InsO family protein